MSSVSDSSLDEEAPSEQEMVRNRRPSTSTSSRSASRSITGTRSSTELDHSAAAAADSEEEGDEEATGLMSSESLMRDEFDDELDEDRACSGSFRILALSMVVVLAVSTLAVLLPGIGNMSNTLESLRTPARIPVTYECPLPTSVDPAENYDASFTDQYEAVSQEITDNMTEFLATFRETHFDDWGYSYNDVKEGMHHFKLMGFAPYLTDGSTLYESACGIGLNLFMTLEILQETKGIENLFVYGNEYVQASADKANAVLDKIAPAHGHKGVICPGDSTHLEFVPSKAFDLVYTGYIRYVVLVLVLVFPWSTRLVLKRNCKCHAVPLMPFCRFLFLYPHYHYAIAHCWIPCILRLVPMKITIFIQPFANTETTIGRQRN